MPGMLQPPNHSLTFIVKGCFDIVEGQPASFCDNDDEAMIMGDTFVEGEMTSSLTYANDMVVFKPKADLTLSGVAYPECGKAGCEVSFSVGNWRKSLAIFNDRFWRWGSASAPEPFNVETPAIALTYENAYGGNRYGFNPVGKGADKVLYQNGDNLQPLPNIEHSHAFLSSPSQTSLPAGFGPLKNGWGDKLALQGTFDDKWLKDGFPGFPHDFNWGYFNSAPQDQQVEYLAGDEELSFQNLRPNVPNFKTKLPAKRPRLFVKGNAAGIEFFHEITVRLDTLHVDMEQQHVKLVWRAVVGVLSDEYEEIEKVCLFVENMSEQAKNKEFFISVLEAAEAEEGAEFEIENFENEKGQDLVISEIEPIEEASEQLAGASETDSAIDSVFLEQFDNLKAQMKKVGMSDSLTEMLSFDMDVNLFTQRLVETYDLDLEYGEKLIAKSKVDMDKFTVEQGYDPSELSSPAQDGIVANSADSVDELSAEEALSEKLSEGSDLEGADLVGADLSGRDLSNRSFREADLSKANLSDANISACDFYGADLTDCIMDSVNAEGAIFDNAILDNLQAKSANFKKISAIDTQFQNACLLKADFSEANISNADFSECIMPKSLFDATVMCDTQFEKADLAQSQFIKVSGKAANFTESNIRECLFSSCAFQEANFSNSRLTLSTFENSELSHAKLEAVDAEAIEVIESTLDSVRAGEKSNFIQAKFIDGTALAIIFAGANLSNAIFEGIPMQSADFSNTDLSNARFSGCDLKTAEFSKCKATDTVLSGLNLFQANFTKANLQRTDLSVSNLYGAEFGQASIKEANLRNANIKRTKIALGMVK
jgi:uncharacterized protein YjbI with pentapeptide repeats